MDALKLMAEGCIKEANPAIRVGDVVKVHVKILEGERERIQVFEGIVLKRMRFGSRGHVDPIKKRTSHITIVVSEKN